MKISHSLSLKSNYDNKWDIELTIRFSFKLVFTESFFIR